MKTSFLVVSVLTVALAAACDRRADPENAPTSDAATADASAVPATDPTAPVTAPDPNAPVATPANDDALALGLLSAIDDHEIQAAQQAIAKPVTGPVLDFARMMEKQHTDNLVQTKALGSVGDTPEVQAMKDKAAGDLAALGKKSGKDYETAYVAAMIKDHTDALALIDGRLLPLSSPGAVRDHIGKSREHVAMHLQEAQNLQTAPQP